MKEAAIFHTITVCLNFTWTLKYLSAIESLWESNNNTNIKIFQNMFQIFF